MKKAILFLLCTVLALSLIGCGSRRYESLVSGKTFLYENGDLAIGDFRITIESDGTFSYYECMLSSFIGRGNWTIEHGALSLTVDNYPTENGSASRTNVFTIEKGKLIWRAEGSDNFTYVKLSDGATFNEKRAG